MDATTDINVAHLDDEAGDDGTATKQSSAKQSSNGNVPPNRRAVGRFIKSRIHETNLTVVEFVHNNGIEDKGKLDRVISGRRKIDVEIANDLVRTLGGDKEFWLTLEHKILASPDTSVPFSNAPKTNNKSGDRNMAAARNSFGEASQNLSPAQIADIELRKVAYVFGEGKDMMTIPITADMETVKEIALLWLQTNRENDPSVKDEPLPPET